MAAGTDNTNKKSANKTNTGKNSSTKSSSTKSNSTKNSTKGNTTKSSTSKTSAAKKARQEAIRRRNKKRAVIAIAMAVVVGIAFAVITTMIMRARYFRVSKADCEYVMGTRFDITNYIIPESEGTKVYCDTDYIEADNVGSYDVEYTLKRGRLSTKRTLTLEVVDKDSPIFEGPDEIYVVAGEDIKWSDYFTIKDSEPDLAEKITCSNNIDTSETGSRLVSLSVVDWSGNNNSKEVTLHIVALEGDEAVAAKAVRAYKLKTGESTGAANIYVMNVTDEAGIAAYVLVDTDVIYTVADDGSCSEYTYSEDDGNNAVGKYYKAEDILTNGTAVNKNDKLYGFY